MLPGKGVLSLRTKTLGFIRSDAQSLKPFRMSQDGTRIFVQDASYVLSVQNVLSGSDRATRRWSVYFPMRRSLPIGQNRTIPFGLIVPVGKIAACFLRAPLQLHVTFQVFLKETIFLFKG